MYKHIALITARGGSKGLPRKNVLPISGKPLIAWTIEAALSCSFIERVFVSTDDDEISDISRDYGAEIIPRPIALAQDDSSSIDVVSHAVRWLEHKNIFSLFMTLLQPTSPLRTGFHIEEAITILDRKDADFVVSVFEPSQTPVKSYIENSDGSIVGLYSKDAPYSRRQDLPRAFQPNGAIYTFSIEKFKLNNNFPRSNAFPYIMSECDSTDIDQLNDFLLVEKRFKELNK